MNHEPGKMDNTELERSEQQRVDEAGNNGAPTHSRANWAWTGTTEHYDWMDSHGPFAGLD
ncbi:hypothetical protein [Paraburkholderia diazotrophica]|uniref:Uncharacterized protein n=1 Tax=Paraburkholderia diazotrophica TaxID=667676 RepID=A0A1H7E6T7_9BURK|nr:hypothetical protein [Paraburkholderia diazotrophica]SEK09673.1 hypothetical protein SAMN05192539_104537 [Paraburkholderia diazotrophica]